MNKAIPNETTSPFILLHYQISHSFEAVACNEWKRKHAVIPINKKIIFSKLLMSIMLNSLQPLENLAFWLSKNDYVLISNTAKDDSSPIKENTSELIC